MSDSCLGCSLSSGGPRNGAPTGAQHLGRMPLQSFHSSPQQAYNFLELCALTPTFPRPKQRIRAAFVTPSWRALTTG